MSSEHTDKHGGVERMLQEQARQLEAIFAYSLDCIVLLDSDYNFIRVNDAYARACGRVPADFIGRNHFDFYPSDAKGLFDSVMATRKPVETFARPFVFPDHPDWGVTYWDWTLVPIIGHDGAVEFLLFTLRDVTQRKRAELELAARKKELELLLAQRTNEVESLRDALRRQERLAALGQLLGAVGHELRTPLGTIQSSIHLVIHLIREFLGTPDAKLDRALERMERNIRRCHDIIEDLLDYTRLGPLKLQETAVDKWLPGVLDEQPFPASISLVKVINTPITVPLDRERTARCINNVVSNAVQAMVEVTQEKSHRLTVEARACHGRVELRFTDTGVGIAPDSLEQVREPLYSTKTFGVGLGLSIVQQIMERHHGGLEIDSVLGEGTTVTLWVPLDE